MSRAPRRYYRTFKIRKGSKLREIQAPRVALKLIQSWFGTHVARSITLPRCVCGFVPNMDGILRAAKEHCGADWVYSLDLRNFFGSVNLMMVVCALESIGYSRQAATFMSRLLTFDGFLPQGSPASPVLSNVAFSSTDGILAEIAMRESIRYTRYADDLVFSGVGDVPKSLAENVKMALVQKGWKIADEKEHLAKRPARLKVHGLLVHGSSPRLTKGYRNRIRAYRHLAKHDKIRKGDLRVIQGHMAYARHIESSET